MNSVRPRRFAFGALLALAAFPAKAAPPKNPIPWDISVLALDGIDRETKLEIPLREAISFVEERSEFRFSVRVFESRAPHAFTGYACKTDPCVVVDSTDVAPGVIAALPVSDSYLLLWNLDGRNPLQGGSTWDVPHGIMKGGVKRPYSTVAVDPWWYANTPFEGFRSRAAQILAHELINVISAKVSAPPIGCKPLTSSALGARGFESQRLRGLDDACYDSIRKNAEADRD